MPHKSSDFIGAWKLVDWRIEYPDGSVTRPFGDGAHGYIVYAADGTMTASIAKANRPTFGIANARNASDHQKAEAFDSYFHYAGPWRIEGEDVIHTVTMSLNPDMTGTEQRRRAVFVRSGDLTLSAAELMKDGRARHHILQWRGETPPVS
jgi:Lipocalin-like domain